MPNDDHHHQNVVADATEAAQTVSATKSDLAPGVAEVTIEFAERLRDFAAAPSAEGARDPWEVHTDMFAGQVADAMERTAIASHAAAFLDGMRNPLPDFMGDHELAHYRNRVTGPRVAFHGNETEEVYRDLQEQAAAAGAVWRDFEVGVGASGFEVIVSFGVSIAANILWDFIKSVREKQLDPRVDPSTALALCRFDLFNQLGKDVTIRAMHCQAAPVEHAVYEVFLYTDESVFTYLIRHDGTICGRKTRVFQESV